MAKSRSADSTLTPERTDSPARSGVAGLLERLRNRVVERRAEALATREQIVESYDAGEYSNDADGADALANALESAGWLPQDFEAFVEGRRLHAELGAAGVKYRPPVIDASHDELRDYLALMQWALKQLSVAAKLDEALDELHAAEAELAAEMQAWEAAQLQHDRKKIALEDRERAANRKRSEANGSAVAVARILALPLAEGILELQASDAEARGKQDEARRIQKQLSEMRGTLTTTGRRSPRRIEVEDQVHKTRPDRLVVHGR